MPRLRIEVLKRTLHEELVREKLPPEVVPHVVLCPEVEEGDVYVAESLDAMPTGFCEAAWKDIVSKIGPQLEADPTIAAPFFLSCMDGLRPVTFEVTVLPGRCPK